MKVIITNADQTATRERLINYQENKGVRWGFIANKVNAPPYIISTFKSGKRNLYDDTLLKLEEHLSAEGF